MSVAGLSITANVLAPVGLADIAFRLGKALYETLTRFKDAPRDVLELLEIVRRLETSIASVSAYTNQYASSPFVREDGQPAPNLDCLLQGCTDEFTKLNQMLHEAAIRQSDSFTIQWTKKTRHLVNENELRKSSRVLDNYINAIGVALATIQGQSQIKLREHASLVRTEIGNMQNAVLTNTTARAVALETTIGSASTDIKLLIDSSTKSIVDTNCAAASNIQEDVLALGTDVQRGFQNNFNAIQSSSQTVVTQLDEHKHANNARLDTLQKDVSQSALKTQNAVQTVRKSVVHAHKDQRIFAKQQTRRSNKLLQGMTELLASVRISETSNNNIQVEGVNLEAVLIPLLLIKPEITKMFATLSRREEMTISNTELTWLEDELENLIKISFESRSTSKRIQNRVEPSRREDRTISRANLSSNPDSLQTKFKHKSVRADVAQHYITTSIGKVVIQRCRYTSGSRRDRRNGAGDTFITFSFMPSQLSFVRTGFDVKFPRYNTSLPRHITTWEILPENSRVFELIYRDNAESVREMIQAGEASIYTCDEDGHSILAYAMQTGSTRVFDLLVRQGARMKTQNALTLLSHVMEKRSWNFHKTAESLFTNWHHMMIELFKTDFDSSEIIGKSPYPLIDVFCAQVIDDNFLSPKYVIPVARTLLEGDGEFPVGNVCGSMGLRYICSHFDLVRSSENDQTVYSLLEYLLSEGVSFQATDSSGWNCLHHITWRAPGSLPQYWSPFALKVVRLLMSAGCDPNGIEQSGLTPFNFPYFCKKGEAPLWSVVFENTPVEAMVIKTTWVNAFSKTCIVVVERGTSKLPISDLSIEEWLELKKIKEQAFWSTMEESGDDTGDECSCDSGDESK